MEPTLSIGDAFVTEGNSGTTTLQFTIQASAVGSGSTPPVVMDSSVDYTTSAGTATEGIDYEAASGTIQIPGESGQVTIDVSVIGDTDIETNETFTITLSSTTNATISKATATGNIRDDDSPMGA